MTDSEAFRYFLIEYKKRLPVTDENKDFHEHIDYMIKYFKSSHRIYQDRWNDWISLNDEKYWRNPTELEKVEIESKRQLKDVERKRKDPQFCIVMASCLLSLFGCLGVVNSGLSSHGIDLYGFVFFSVFVLQGLLTLSSELGLIKFSIWGWLY